MVLEATSRLRMVLQNLESVLLERNLKSCTCEKSQGMVRFVHEIDDEITYPHEKMLIKILAFRVLLRLFLYSASFIQVDTLNEIDHKLANAKHFTKRASARR